MQSISKMTNMLSKRITGEQPEKNLDVKDSKALSEAAKVSEAVKDSKALSEAVIPSEAVVTETTANSEQIDEVVKGTKRLSIQDNEEQKDEEIDLSSKKRPHEQISNEQVAKEDGSFVTATDKSDDSKKVSPDSSKRLKLDETPPKMTMSSPEVVEQKDVEVTYPVAGEFKPEGELVDEKIEEEKPDEIVVNAPEFFPEPSAEAIVSDPVVPMPEAESKPEDESKEPDAISTPSVVKDIPTSKLQ